MSMMLEVNKMDKEDLKRFVDMYAEERMEQLKRASEVVEGFKNDIEMLKAQLKESLVNNEKIIHGDIVLNVDLLAASKGFHQWGEMNIHIRGDSDRIEFYIEGKNSDAYTIPQGDYEIFLVVKKKAKEEKEGE